MSVMAVGIVQQVLMRTFVGIYIGAFRMFKCKATLSKCAFILEIYVMVSMTDCPSGDDEFHSSVEMQKYIMLGF